MAKRFTDTEIWNKKWFRKLPPEAKLFWSYIKDKCDVAGIIELDFELCSFQIGLEIDENILEKFIHKIIKLEDGKYFIPAFIPFQYGTLSEKCKPHFKVFEALKKHRVSETYWIGYTKGIQTLEEKEEDKDKEKDKDKGGMGEKGKLLDFGEEDQKLIREKAEVIRKIHPRIKQPLATDLAIINAIIDQVDNGKSVIEAIKFIGEKTQMYAYSVKELWSKEDQKFIVTSLKWYQNGGYLEDPMEWGLDVEAHRKGSSKPEVVL